MMLLSPDLFGPLAVLLLLIAPCAGSFIGVLADRLVRDEDVVRKRSFCRSCGAGLRVRDLVPILSYLALRGRCGTCGATIPGWLLHVEIAAFGLAVVALAASGGVASVAWAAALLWWVLLALILCDLRAFRLPDALTLALVITAFGLGFPGLAPSPAQAALGAVIGAGSFLALRWGYAALRGREGLGLGDVKLMAGLGALLGARELPLMVLLAALTALAVALVAPRSQHLRGDHPLPFGAALAASGGVLWGITHLPV